MAHVSLAVWRMAFKPTQASVKRWKIARKKRPTHAPNVAAVSLMHCERLKCYTRHKEYIPWHPVREPEHVHTHDSMKRHHIHYRDGNIHP